MNKITTLFNDKNMNIDEYLQFLKNNIKFDPIIGYAGFKSFEGLENTIRFFTFGKNINLDVKKYDVTKIKLIIEESLNESKKLINDDSTNVFVFPTVNNFIITKLDGINGLSPWKHTILLFINIHDGYEHVLKNVVVHEYCHTKTHEYQEWKSLQDSIVFEGLAENFREYLLKNGREKWTTVFNEDESKLIFAKIKSLLNNADNETYRKIFFDDKDYKLWTGYTLGYYIVKNYIVKNKINDWDKLIRVKPEEMIKTYE